MIQKLLIPFFFIAAVVTANAHSDASCANACAADKACATDQACAGESKAKCPSGEMSEKVKCPAGEMSAKADKQACADMAKCDSEKMEACPVSGEKTAAAAKKAPADNAKPTMPMPKMSCCSVES
jgi:hypothetical protein